MANRMLKEKIMATNSMSTCFCTGKRKGCTCNGRCACACTCSIDMLEPFGDLNWIEEIKDPGLIPEGQKELHRTKGGKGVVGQAIAKDKLRKLPPNCS